MSYYGSGFPGQQQFSPGGYRGDPGFFSVLGKIGKAALGLGASVVPGGGIVSKGISMAGKIAGSKAGRIVGTGIQVARKHPVLTAAGAAAAVGGAGAGVSMIHTPTPAGGGMAIAGHGLTISRRTGLPVRRRHMRVTNVKALHRAVRRCAGFERLAKRVLHISSPHKRHVFKGFKKRRSKK